MRSWLPIVGVAILAALAGVSLHLAGRGTPPPAPAAGAVDITPAALLAARFKDTDGRDQTLAPMQGQVLVLNFWATWCTPCREEMPGFVRLQARWQDKGVRFVGIASDEPAKVAAFGRELAINYPLWVGEGEVMELSRRLGNRLGVLPHTAIVDRHGRVVDTRIGIYSEPALESRLKALTNR